MTAFTFRFNFGSVNSIALVFIYVNYNISLDHVSSALIVFSTTILNAIILFVLRLFWQYIELNYTWRFVLCLVV